MVSLKSTSPFYGTLRCGIISTDRKLAVRNGGYCLKYLFEYIVDSFSLLENPLDDYVVMAIIGIIAYGVAYSLVGKLYNYDIIDGRGAGHILHWIIRLIVFVIIFYLAATAIRIYNWFVALPNYKWWIIGLAMGGSIVIYGLCKVHSYRKRVLQEQVK